MILPLLFSASISTTLTLPHEKAFSLINNGINVGNGWISIINNTYYIRISDTGNLMWYPVIDNKNGIIDFANCVRLKPNRKDIIIIGGLSQSGARLASSGANLNSAPTNDRIPLKEIGKLLGYEVNIDQKNNSVIFTRFSKEKISNSYLRGCLQIGTPIAN